ncbi:MAG: uracil-DNA glycosylase family protein [Bacteroidaceae bacterium]|nr:uracil-DNA glycosylase family protein [Bacteroidaceae bacterium]
MTIENHPLQPFLPPGAHTLFLGSFPPPRAKWSMDFFYPNWINDFWRIMGLIHHGDKAYFEVPGQKRFDQQRIVRFATEQGLAFYDTATQVRRLKDNASDNFLEILQPTDIPALLRQLPHCLRLVTTGGKASEELQAQLSLSATPAIGTCLRLNIDGRTIQWWRMPSTSRAYPLAIEKKAAYYRQLFTSTTNP